MDNVSSKIIISNEVVFYCKDDGGWVNLAKYVNDPVQETECEQELSKE